jgi:hypothetical protein
MPINLSTNLVLDSSENRADGVYLDTVKKVVGAWYTADDKTEVMSLTGSANERNLLLPGQIFYVKATNEMLIYSRSGNFPLYSHFFNQFTWPGSGGSAATGSLLTTASLAGSDLTFTKGNGDQFTLTLPSGGSGFPFDGDAVITGSLLVSGSGFTVTGSSNFDGIINASSVTSSFKGDLDGTASIATTAISASNLYFNDTKKAEATNTGLTVTGGLITDASSDMAGLNMTSDIAMGDNNIGGVGSISSKVDASLLDGQINATSSLTVTAAAKTTNNRYYNQGSGNAYYFNGIESPYITFYPGKSYRIAYPASHPVAFYLDANKATQYTTGVTTPATNTVQIDVTEDTPKILYYMCTAHDLMGNATHIQSANSASFAGTSSIALKNLSTASVSLNTITFTKGDGTTFPITVDTGSDESGIFKQTGSFFATSNDLQVTGSITSSFKGDLTGTASLASHSLSANSASFVTGSNVYGPFGANSVISASYAVSASVEIIKEISSSHAEVADVADGLQNNPSIAVTNITASGGISASGLLFASASQNEKGVSSPVDNVAMYNSASGQFFYTASSAIGGGGSAINATGSGLDGGSPGGEVSTITIQDYDADVVVQYNAGDLKFIFGTPTAPTPSIGQSGFLSDRFNLQLQTYTITGTFGLGGYSLVSASLFSGSDQLETGTTGTSLARTFTDVTGEIAEKTYSLQLTSSNPVTSTEDRQLETVALSLSKSNPVSPSNTFNVDAIYLGAASNQIEVGATGSIAFTGSKSGTDNSWTFVSMSASPSTDPTITSTATSISASYNISASGVDSSVSFFSTANYNSAALNNPVINANRNSSTQTYSRIRSIRFGAFLESATASLEAGMTDLGAFQAGGTIYKGTVDPNNQSVNIAHGSGVIEYIVVDDAYTLTAIEAGGTNFLTSTFTHTTAGGSPQVISGYRVYKSSTPLGATSGITYLLKT